MLGVIGDLVEDIVVWFDGGLRYATDNPARVVRSRGGSGANVAAAAAPLVATRFIGCVGEDATGDALVGELRDTGVDVRVQRRGHTGTIVVIVDEDGERTMFPDRGAAGELRDIEHEWMAGLRALHLPSYCFATEPAAGAVLAFARAAHEHGIEISVDASSTGLLADLGVEAYRQLLAQIRPALVFANAREAELLDLDRPLFATMTTVVKNGARPTLVREPGRSAHRVPVSPVAEVRDTTGAGDAFAAGFLAARLRGSNALDAATAGHESARAVLLSPGAQVRTTR